MITLTQQKCIPCRKQSTPSTEAEIKALKSQIPEWKITNQNGILCLKRAYIFPNFKAALAFTQQVGEVAEQEGHHPSLLTEWGKVTVSWWTYAISGLHRNDFIMAAKTDQIAELFL